MGANPKSLSVDQFLASLNLEQIDLVNQIRSEVKAAAPGLVEGIKWNAPSYSLDGNDIITFNFRNYQVPALIFHTGPGGKDTRTGRHSFQDPSGAVEWLADKRFVVKIASGEELQLIKARLEEWVVNWVAYARQGFEP
jgi:hypothetical protein